MGRSPARRAAEPSPIRAELRDVGHGVEPITAPTGRPPSRRRERTMRHVLSEWELTVRDGAIASATNMIAFTTNGFSEQVSEPFADWVATTYPDHVMRVSDDGRRQSSGSARCRQSNSGSSAAGVPRSPGMRSERSSGSDRPLPPYKRSITTACEGRPTFLIRPSGPTATSLARSHSRRRTPARPCTRPSGLVPRHTCLAPRSPVDRRYPHRSAPGSRRLVARLHGALGERYGTPGTG